MGNKKPANDWADWLAKARRAKEWTQHQMADAVGIQRSTYANYELGSPPRHGWEGVIAKFVALGIQPPPSEVGRPLHPYAAMLVPIPQGAPVPCSDWSDPLDAEYDQFVEVDSFFAGKGRFACPIIGDSMYDLLWPGDLCIWQHDMVPKLGTIIIARNSKNEATCAQLKHDGQHFVLHKLNARYDDATSDEWTALGFLVGILRVQGSKRITVYDPNGIRP